MIGAACSPRARRKGRRGHAKSPTASIVASSEWRANVRGKRSSTAFKHSARKAERPSTLCERRVFPNAPSPNVSRPTRFHSEAPRRQRRVHRAFSKTTRRWTEGCVRGRHLFQEIRARGYTGSMSHLQRLLAQWRNPKRTVARPVLPASGAQPVDPTTG